MAEKADVTAKNVDLARFAFGAYQAYGAKPVRIERYTDGEGNPGQDIFGQVNPCRFGDQCGGHACYCNHPESTRKCHFSWYYGGERGTEDKDCPFFEANPYWQESESGDYYEGRTLTIAALKEKDMVDDIPEEENLA